MFSEQLGHVFGAGGAESLSRVLEVPFVGRIPIDPRVAGEEEEERETFSCIARLAKELAEQ